MVLLTDIVSAKKALAEYSEKNRHDASILVFIDAGVESPQFLADGIVPEAKAFILDRHQDGIRQITEILQDYSAVESIHLISHGSPGSLQLGNTYLSLDTLDSYQSELQTWSQQSSIVLYGCNVAAGDAGEEFLNKLHQLTGADIAASKTKTGNSKLGGDWNLEITTDLQTPALAFKPETTDGYTGVLNRFIDSGQSLGNSKGYDVSLADLDGDGDQDAFVVNDDGQPNEVWLNDGSGIFTDSGQSLGSSNSLDVSLADLDGDGDQDAFVANNRRQPNEVWLNDGSGTFTDSGQSLGDLNSFGVRLADLDGDDDQDAFVTNVFAQNEVWLNDGSGTFTDSGQSLGGSDYASYSVSLADLDGDGDQDAFVVNYNEQANEVWLNDGLGIFTDSGQSLGSSNSLDVSLADLDGDGDLDAFVANISANKVWLNDGSGTFTDSGQSLGAPTSFGVSLADLNGDGDQDAFVATYSTPNQVWFNNFAPEASIIDGGTTNEDAANPFVVDLLSTASDIDANDELSIAEGAVATSTNEARELIFTVDESGQLNLDPDQFSDLAAEESETITVSYEVTDGTEAVANTATFVVEGRNDAPVNNIPETIGINEDNLLLFTGANAISISDPEGDLQSTTLSLNEGVLSVDEVESLIIEGNDSDTIRLMGSQGDINAALATLEYTPNEDFNGNDLLSILSNDAAGEFDADFKLINVVSVNDAPTLEIPIAEQLEEGDNVAAEDAPFSLTLDEGTFADLRDPEDSLSYSAMVEGEAGVFEPLPESGWLEFDAETQTFSGTPENDDVGEYQLKVVATDGGDAVPEGEELTAEDTFTLTVENTNDAPTVTDAFYDQLQSETTGVKSAIYNGSILINPYPEAATRYIHNFNLLEERDFSIILPKAAFSDVDVDDQLTYSATLSNGEPLPEGFFFDPETLTLSGNPDDDAVREGSYEVMVMATDEAGASAGETIVLDIENFNDAPILDLNGLDEPSKNFVAEGVDPSSNLMSVVDRDLSLTDVDNDTLNAATVRIANLSNGFSESLTANTRGTDIQRTYDANRGILYLIGEDSVENYQDVLRTVQYYNSLDSGINQELVLEFGVWDFPAFDYPSFEYPYFGLAENLFNEESDLGNEIDDEFPSPEYQVASAVSYTQFETDTTIGFEGISFGGISFAEGTYLAIRDTDGGDTDDEFALSLDANNNTLVVDTNSDFGISDGFSGYLGWYLLDTGFSENILGTSLGEEYYDYLNDSSIQAINGQTEVDFKDIGRVEIDNMDGEDSILVDVSDLDLMESYMGSNLYLNIDNRRVLRKFSEEMLEMEEVMPTPSNELELKGNLSSGESFDQLYHYFDMDYGVSIYAEHYNPDMEDDYYSSHDSVGISYPTDSMKTVVDELDVNERIYGFEGNEGVVVTINDNQAEDDGKSMISSSLSSESIIFSNPNDALHVETSSYYGGNDMVNVDGIDGDFIADLMISTYEGNDTIKGGASDEMIVGGADGDLLTGGAGEDTFVLNSLDDSLLLENGSFAFDTITDLDTNADMIAAPMAAQSVSNFGVLDSFSISAVTNLLVDMEPNQAGIVEYQTRSFLVINDSNTGFDIESDAVIGISGYEGMIEDLTITRSGSAGDEIIVSGADGDLLTGGAGEDTFVLNSLDDSLLLKDGSFAFDTITDLDTNADMIAAPMAVESINDFGVIDSFSIPAVTNLLFDMEPNQAGIVEYQTRSFLVINDSNTGFGVDDDAVIEISGYEGMIEDLTIISSEEIMMI